MSVVPWNGYTSGLNFSSAAASLRAASSMAFTLITQSLPDSKRRLRFCEKPLVLCPVHSAKEWSCGA